MCGPVEHCSATVHDGVCTPASDVPTARCRCSGSAMTVRIQSLASGSSGNALLVRGESATILVDCGLAPRELMAMLAAVDCAITEVDTVLITHEHGDHTRGLPLVFSAKRPVLTSWGTAAALGLPPELWIRPATDNAAPVQLGAATVQLLPVSHDASEPCGYTIDIDGVRCTVLTDIGRPEPAYSALFRQSDLLVIEANHDRERLRNGPYPSRLKQRVASTSGHLSNQACGEWLATALRSVATPPEIWLAHLSRVNNLPELAAETVKHELTAAGVTTAVTALPRRTVGPVWASSTRRERPLNMPVQLQLTL